MPGEQNQLLPLILASYPSTVLSKKHVLSSLNIVQNRDPHRNDEIRQTHTHLASSSWGRWGQLQIRKELRKASETNALYGIQPVSKFIHVLPPISSTNQESFPPRFGGRKSGIGRKCVECVFVQ